MDELLSKCVYIDEQVFDKKGVNGFCIHHSIYKNICTNSVFSWVLYYYSKHENPDRNLIDNMIGSYSEDTIFIKTLLLSIKYIMIGSQFYILKD